ncbi:uncharacterized protein [Triticum aestivum]|uniref:uncharacterized protein n=1 Tax=Triticum aestivum TaxID=4565 RepID=UPI001D0121C5|nr:uncharacterized protein LOC123129837 [Triticum aestivum]
MMNRIMIACSSEEPVLSVANTYCVPEHFISRFDEEFPFRTTGGSVHKILRMLSMLLAGVPMESMSTKSVSHHFTGGEIRAIHFDDLEEVCWQIADGNAVLATFFDGVGYEQLQYCQYYTAMPASVVAQLIADGEDVSAHVVVLVGVISEQGHRAYFALDSAGTAFCRQVGSAEGWRSLFNWNKKSQLGGYGKITADSAWFTNFFKVSRQNDHGLPPKLFVANHDPDDYLVDNIPTDLAIIPQEEGDIILAARNRRYVFHGRYLRRRFRQLWY